MFSVSLTSTLSILASVALSSVLQLPQSADDQLNDTPLSPNSTDVTTVAISSSLPTHPGNHSANNAPHITCDKSLGNPMSFHSCLDVLQQIPRSEKEMTFGQRGVRRPDVPLPYRLLSCELLDLPRLGDPLHLRGIPDSSCSRW